MFKDNNKRKISIISGVITLLVVSFLFYNFVVKADTDANKIAIKNATLTKIDTGTGTFKDDGLNYSDDASYTKIEGYTPGNDSNEKNRIVRSFDVLTYHFNYQIDGKEPGNDYEERKVDIIVTLSEENSKYIAFDKNAVAGETKHTFTFDGIDSYGSFDSEIKLYLLGAPNGMLINPKFDIQESTNTDSNYMASLGSVSFEGEVYNYSYDLEATNKYVTTPTVSGFTNYMPTITSSKTANMRYNLIGDEFGQKATYKNNIGRYLTYIIGIEMVGDDDTGIKGYTMPNGDDIEFNFNVSQAATNNAIVENEFVRLYGTSDINGIKSIESLLPYSSTDAQNRIKHPGNIAVENIENNKKVTIKGYEITFESVRLSSMGYEIPKSEYYINTFTITAFSPRSAGDGNNVINVVLNLSETTLKDTAGNNINIMSESTTSRNSYYSYVDYSLNGEFYDLGNNILSEITGDASLSKGSELLFKTKFNYNKSLSDQGLKEIIKIDPDAFKVIPYGEKDIQIKIKTKDGVKFSEDDFEVTYLTGNFENSNYSVTEVSSKLDDAEKELATSQCAIIRDNLSTYNKDQIMNLYGGPCIKSNEGVEEKFTKISEASNEGKEIPITKIIVQTKEGIVLPDSVEIEINVKLRVKNVSDITKTYQVTSVAMSSDYDSKLTYYDPRITESENSITNPNNYKKTVYSGSDIVSYSSYRWGDCLKIVNFTSRQEITVTNKNSDGSTKTNYNVSDGETINYNIKTIIQDENEKVGADDVWYINHLKVAVAIPEGLVYIPDKKLGNPEVISVEGYTILMYILPYTKPNMKIQDINFKASLSPKIQGSGVELIVVSNVEAININNEKDTSYFTRLMGSFAIYANGIQNVILSQKVGNQGSVVEKNSEFSYIISAYNNTDNYLTDYEIMNILPSNGDKNGSTFKGSYKVKLTLPDSLGTAKVTCSKQQYSKLTNEVSNSLNEFKECGILDDFVEATAIKISDVSIAPNSYIDDIKLTIKPNNNEYDNKYINSFVGASESYAQTNSNKIEVRVISRRISGRIFVDLNENGIEDENEKYLANIPVSIYKLDSSNNMKKIEETVTNNEGKYEFKNLDVGRYKIRANYDSSIYDLTLRYATEDIVHDSDGYKIDDNIIEISNKRTPSESDGIKVTRDIESVENMNIGLISKKSFGFDITKYITKVELVNNGVQSTKNYNNLNKVTLSVRNTYSARVYYGIKITNNSTQAGYVKKIDENIPNRMIFDSKDAYNSEWIYTNGTVQSIALENELINPGEVKYLKIVLNIPTTNETGTFINEATILDIQAYEPFETEDQEADTNTYTVGEAVSYAGIDWHVVSTQNMEAGEQMLTLLADSGSVVSNMFHTKENVYKWSESAINSYLNSGFLNTNSLDMSVLQNISICDDASGLPTASFGGTFESEGTCQSGIYTTSKVRLLTEKEYNDIMASSTEDKSWITGNYWLMNSSSVVPTYNDYGMPNSETNTSNKVKAVSSTNIVLEEAGRSKEVRPVITISSRNIIPE